MSKIIHINLLRVLHTIRCEMESEKKEAEKRFRNFLKDHPHFEEEQTTVNDLIGYEEQSEFKLINGGKN